MKMSRDELSSSLDTLFSGKYFKFDVYEYSLGLPVVGQEGALSRFICCSYLSDKHYDIEVLAEQVT